MLTPMPEFEIVGEAATGEEVISRTAKFRPDMILTDIQISGLNGIKATRRLL